ncbi:MAG: hypothetical protein QHH07_04075 [Sedimentisphaerales bacterium]|nr:hypothetical protein [Sedimentisphaerales bacterium]
MKRLCCYAKVFGKSPLKMMILIGGFCCLGVLLAQGQLLGITQGNPGTLYTSISQSIQSGTVSGGLSITGPAGTQGSYLATGDGWATGQVCVGTSGCGCTPSTCTPCEPTETYIEPCNPFADLIGKWVTIQMEGGVVVSGLLQKDCSGFLILKGQNVTLTVNIQKILFIESN